MAGAREGADTAAVAVPGSACTRRACAPSARNDRARAAAAPSGEPELATQCGEEQAARAGGRTRRARSRRRQSGGGWRRGRAAGACTRRDRRGRRPPRVGRRELLHAAEVVVTHAGGRAAGQQSPIAWVCTSGSSEAAGTRSPEGARLRKRCGLYFRSITASHLLIRRQGRIRRRRC